MPPFVRTCRELDAFWPVIKGLAGHYAKRWEIIRNAVNPLVEHLEGRNRAPGGVVATEALASFDAEGVQAVWSKALARRHSDPAGAITVARTLLGTVCKRILTALDAGCSDRDDLPKLYSTAAKALRLAPDQHAEEPIKAMLGGAMSFVNGVGTLRNRLSDAHAPGGRAPVRPSERHAKLAVNTASAVATFLAGTYLDQRRA